MFPRSSTTRSLKSTQRRRKLQEMWPVLLFMLCQIPTGRTCEGVQCYMWLPPTDDSAPASVLDCLSSADFSQLQSTVEADTSPVVSPAVQSPIQLLSCVTRPGKILLSTSGTQTVAVDSLAPGALRRLFNLTADPDRPLLDRQLSISKVVLDRLEPADFQGVVPESSTTAANGGWLNAFSAWLPRRLAADSFVQVQSPHYFTLMLLCDADNTDSLADQWLQLNTAAWKITLSGCRMEVRCRRLHPQTGYKLFFLRKSADSRPREQTVLTSAECESSESSGQFQETGYDPGDEEQTTRQIPVWPSEESTEIRTPATTTTTSWLGNPTGSQQTVVTEAEDPKSPEPDDSQWESAPMPASSYQQTSNLLGVWLSVLIGLSLLNGLLLVLTVFLLVILCRLDVTPSSRLAVKSASFGTTHTLLLREADLDGLNLKPVPL